MADPHPRLLRHAGRSPEPLRENAPHRHAAEHALVHYPSGAVYSFIPKNACSTLRLSLAVANGAIAGPEGFAWIHKNNATFRADLRALATAPYSFAILRCPYRRLASAFLDKIVSRRREFWDLHRAHGDGIDPDALTFRGFVAAIAPPRMLRSDGHWRPQIDFLVYRSYDDLFRMEAFAAVARRLEDRIGLSLIDARPLTRHGADGLERVAGAHADTPCHALLEMRRAGAAPRPESLYDPDLVAGVAGLYRQDLSFYEARFGARDLLFDPGGRPRRDA